MNSYSLAQKVEAKYLQYLKTMFYFKDTGLRKSFEDALDAGRLSNGPYLEATPVFKRAKKPSELFAEILGFEPEQSFLKAVDGERPLYCHQEEAIRSTALDKNVIIATGTGSGKTEAFLFPILLHLYKEFKIGKLGHGVRALILYPMNALAFDQRERLGKICARLEEFNSDFRFTFGQYVGDTPDDRNDRQRNAREALENRLSGELVLREEMRSQPPHILLTNYSMLEFMLLRPKDTPLFDNGNAQWWKFIVLDEAHQYRGTKGMEMGMLLRRLKQRLYEGGRQNEFLCIATSATLSSDTKDKRPVAQFAQDLFGEPFEPEHIITGEYEKLVGGHEETLTPADYKQIESTRFIPVSELQKALSSITSKLGVDLPQLRGWREAIYIILQKDARATKLREQVTGKAIKIDKLVQDIFPVLKSDDEKIESLIRLVQLLVSAESPVNGSPLLTARFHFFLRSLEGAYLSLADRNSNELNPSAVAKILLDRTSVQQGHAFFEIALCRECGQHYFVGKLLNGKLQEAIRDPGDVDFGANFFRPIDAALLEQNEVDEFNANSLYQLCLICAALSRHPVRPACNHGTIVYVEQQEPARNQPDQVSKCSACGYQAADPVREIVHGSDGPNAVIATALVQNLPVEKKKVLAFADSRQQAAFFAWYLDDSYQSILSRALILHALKRLSPTGPISFNELASALSRIYEEHHLFPETMGEIDRKSTVWQQIYSEFLTEETNQSLEGVGLVRYTMKWPSWLDIGNCLNDSPLNLSELEKYIALETLLNFVRMDKAVELKLPRLVNLNWNDLGLFSPQMTVRIGEPQNQRNVRVRSWDGEKGRRARWLARIFENAGIAKPTARDSAVTALRAIWQVVSETDRKAASQHERIFYEVSDAKRLNPDWWRIQLVENDDAVYQCLACGRLQHTSMKSICNRSNCRGKLIATKLAELEPNHYRILYTELKPERLRVEEHTAQLAKAIAREYQRDFRENKIQVLSCSTTFELGVDLGDLDTVFLRNVPPESFNYTQRVGRAGRRPGNIGFAITYCRRNAHDLYHFDEPERMISGKVKPPTISKNNQKIITRHLTAAALSFFFRKFPHRFDCVESFFVDLYNPSASKDFRAFLEKDGGKVLSSLKSIVNTNQQDGLGLNDNTWIERLASAALYGAEARVNADFKTVKNFESESSKLGNHLQADWAKKRANTIAKEDILTFLSRTVVIPKYGFPVDVVELDTQHTNGAFESDTVTLERDLSIAIAEFAPTSKLVANKFEWKSHALKKVAEKEWSRWYYARCGTHHRFERWQVGESSIFTKCCNHMTTRQYVVPQFGFQTKRERPHKPLRKTERIFSTRPYFVGFKSEKQQIIKHGVIELTKTSPGEMVVLCEGYKGQGFYICPRCGTGFRELTRSELEKGHEDSLGRLCTYRPERFLTLGHDFVTDVMKMTFNKPYTDNIEPQWFAFTLAYAILEGASKVLDVPPNELNVTVYAYDLQGVAPSIILYDNVPGGAGLVARLEVKEMLTACIMTALDRVDGRCGCAPDTTCYGCLRNYRNQFAHPYLQRGCIYSYLLELLRENQ